MSVQMAKLYSSQYFHSCDGQLLLSNHIFGSIGFNVYGRLFSINNQFFVRLIQFFLNFFILKDTLRSSKMFSRNNSNRLLSLSHSWPALVSNLVLVYVNRFQLFLLWRKFGRLFWSSSTQNCKFISLSF
jgi:hypothetical protein